MNAKIPIFYSALHTKSCCSVSLAGARMYWCKGAYILTVGDSVSENKWYHCKEYLWYGFYHNSCVSKKSYPPPCGMGDDISKNMTAMTERELWGAQKWTRRDRAGELFSGGQQDSPSLAPPKVKGPTAAEFLISNCVLHPPDEIAFSHSAFKMWLLSAHFACDYFHPLLFGKGEDWGVDWWNDLFSAAQRISIAAGSELLMLSCDFMIISTESVPHSYDFDQE